MWRWRWWCSSKWDNRHPCRYFSRKPTVRTCNNNSILYCDLRIEDPVNSVDYNSNNISIAKQGIDFEELELPASEAISTSFTMNVNGNTVFENWPIGTSTDPATDFYIYNFSILDANGNPSVDAISAEIISLMFKPTHRALWYLPLREGLARGRGSSWMATRRLK